MKIKKISMILLVTLGLSVLSFNAFALKAVSSEEIEKKLQIFQEEGKSLKVDIKESCRGSFDVFIESVELFINTDFFDGDPDKNGLRDVRIIGALSMFDYAEEMVLWPNLLNVQRKALGNLNQAMKEYVNSVYDAKTEYEKWESIKIHAKNVYQAFIKNVPSAAEKEVIYAQRIARGIEILKGIGYPGIEKLESKGSNP
jgi:hypothetical protein